METSVLFDSFLRQIHFSLDDHRPVEDFTYVKSVCNITSPYLLISFHEIFYRVDRKLYFCTVQPRIRIFLLPTLSILKQDTLGKKKKNCIPRRTAPSLGFMKQQVLRKVVHEIVSGTVRNFASYAHAGYDLRRYRSMKLDPTKTTVLRYGKLLDNDKNYVAKYQESSVVSLLTKGNANLGYTMFFLFFL